MLHRALVGTNSEFADREAAPTNLAESVVTSPHDGFTDWRGYILKSRHLHFTVICPLHDLPSKCQCLNWMNLATMEIDFASDSSSVSNNGCTSSSYFSFWVDANFIKLPFIESTLFPDGVHVGKCESATRRKAKAQAKGTENAPTNQVNPQCPVWPGQLT